MKIEAFHLARSVTYPNRAEQSAELTHFPRATWEGERFESNSVGGEALAGKEWLLKHNYGSGGGWMKEGSKSIKRACK